MLDLFVRRSKDARCYWSVSLEDGAIGVQDHERGMLEGGIWLSILNRRPCDLLRVSMLSFAAANSLALPLGRHQK